MKKIQIMIMLLFLLLVIIVSEHYQEKIDHSVESKDYVNQSMIDNFEKSDEMNKIETNLPLIIIETGNEEIEKETQVWGKIVVFDGEETNKISNKADFGSDLLINYRGASSYSTFDKPQFRIKLFKNKDLNKEKNYSLGGMGAHDEWVLNGPFLDRSLLRNALMYGLSKDILEWAPDSRFCEVIVNGEYLGVYLAVEPVTNGEFRLRLSKFALLSGETAYVIKRDRIGTEEVTLETYGNQSGYTNNEVSVVYPAAKNLLESQLKWIEKDVSAFEMALYSDNFADPVNGYAKYIDVGSFVDYYILNEVAMITDACQLSSYTYQELGGKLKMTVWDFNNGFDNYAWYETPIEEFYAINNWYVRLMEDPNFVAAIMKRYQELRENELATEKLITEIDKMINILGPAIDRNFEVWGYTFNQKMLSPRLDGSFRDSRSYDEAVLLLKDTLTKRLEFLDDHLEDLEGIDREKK